MKKKKIIGAALAVGLSTIGAHAAIQVPQVNADAQGIFGMSETGSPSLLLAKADGKCGSGKCGDKKGDHKCGADKKGDHKCGADKKGDHKCGGKKGDHKCGAGKCGGSK